MGVGGLDWRICFKSCLLNCARTIVAALWDFDVLHSGLLAEPDDLENGADHGLERGPAIEWGHASGIHGCPGITVSAALFYRMVLQRKSWREETCIRNVPLVGFSVWKPRVVCPIPSTLLQKCFA